MKLDYYQKDAIKSISETFKKHKKCLLKMYCGTGKTRTMFYYILNNHNKIILVFPTLILVEQFNMDYSLHKMWLKYTNDYQKLNICSKSESQIEIKHNVKTTTSVQEIKDFIKSNDKYIISITYQSLNVLYQVMNQNDFNCDIIVCDEAHHLVGDKAQEYIFGIKKIDDDNSTEDFLDEDYLENLTDEDYQGNLTYEDSDENTEYDDIDSEDEDFTSLQDYSKNMLFLTATPKNRNGIKMYNFNNNVSSKTHCGPCAYNYTHIDAINDGVCKDIRIELDLYTDNTDKNVYKSIGRAIGNSKNNRLLTFHSRSEVSSNNKSDVISFVKNKRNIISDIKDVLEEEFPDNDFKKLKLTGITGKDKVKDRIKIINDFDKTPNYNISILSSCRTIGEGVDTKNGNALCFIDPKQSYSDILQNIGRITRNITRDKKIKPASVIIPCWIDREKYKLCKTPEERDKVIRDEMSKEGNFNGIMNVLSAMRQDDPYYFDLCLKYPSKYIKGEIEESLNNQGYKCIPIEKETVKNEINEGIVIEIRTNDIDEPIIYYNKEKSNAIEKRYYYDDEIKEYKEIVLKDKKIGKNSKLKLPKRHKPKINVHTNDEIKVLWNITNFDRIDKEIEKGYLETRVIDNVDKWYEKLEKVKKYIDENNKRPSERDKNKEIKVLGYWVSHQIKNYQKKTKIMSNNNIRKEWEEFITNEKYKEYFISNDDKWFNNLKLVKKYIDENNKRPSERDKNKEIKVLGKWLSKQITNYQKKTYIMSNNNIRKEWEEFITDYQEYFLNNIAIQLSKSTPKKTKIEPKKLIKKSTIFQKEKHKSIYQELTKKMSIQNSLNTSEMFTINPNKWHIYHDNRDESFKGYDNQEEIPLNKIISYLKTKEKHKLKILDLGCGRNKIKENFKLNKKFHITGYDHVSFNGSKEGDISKLSTYEEKESIDVCVFSQSLMGSNWKEYIREAIKVLRYNGELIISESIERYETIKSYLKELNIHLKVDDLKKDNRWFVINGIKN